MLLNILKYTGQSPTRELTGTKVSSAKVENLGLDCIELPLFIVGTCLKSSGTNINFPFECATFHHIGVLSNFYVHLKYKLL